MGTSGGAALGEAVAAAGGAALDEATAAMGGVVAEGVGSGAPGSLCVQESASTVDVTPSVMVMLRMRAIFAWRRGDEGSHLRGGALRRLSGAAVLAHPARACSRIAA